MAEKSATIEIDVKGADKAVADAKRVMDSFVAGAGKAGSAFSTLKGMVGPILSSVASDMNRVVAAGSQISFAGSVAGAQSFEAAASKMAVATGRSFTSVRDSLTSLSAKLGSSPEEVARYVTAVGKSTYDFRGAEKNIEAFSKFAKETGRDLGEETGLAVAFKHMGVEDADRGLRELRGTAESFKSAGGVAALGAQVAALAPAFSKASNNAGQLMALTAALGNKLPAAQAQEVQQAIVGTFSGSQRMYEAHFRGAGMLKKGETLTDAQGRFDLAKAMQLRQKELRAMNRETALTVASGEFGSSMAAAAFLSADLSRKGIESLDTSAQRAFASTPEGKRQAAAAKIDRAMYEKVGAGSFLGQTRQQLLEATAANPVMGAIAQKLPESLQPAAMAYQIRLAETERRGGFAATLSDVYSAKSGLTLKERLALGYGGARVRSREEAGGEGVGVKPLFEEIKAKAGSDTAALTNAVDKLAKQTIVVRNYTGGPIEASTQPGGDQ